MSAPIPTDITLHRRSKLLEITFDDGERFELPCEYLRVHSPSAEVQGHGPDQRVLQTGKRGVNIERIEPVGRYGIKLVFDDGHDTGIYSWETLYRLGQRREQLWKSYLEELEAAGASRDP